MSVTQQMTTLCAGVSAVLMRPVAADCTCPDGSALLNSDPPCTGGPPVGDTCSGPGTNTADNITTMPGMTGSGTSMPTCTTLPCAASLLGDVALTVVDSSATGWTNSFTGQALPVGENVYGPFEAGFGEQQKDILKGLGCTDANVANAYVIAGLDTMKAEAVVAKGCSVTLPRTESDGTYVSLLDQCGGHTQDYHFHERLKCLYDVDNAAGTHSPLLAEQEINGAKHRLYGKWEATDSLPVLDACGGSYGRTPESPDVDVYHYHIQTKAPFTFGCYGPNPDGSLVTLDQCRDLYEDCDSTKVVDAGDGTNYTPFCPCWDSAGSNVVPDTYVKGQATSAPTTSTTSTTAPTTSTTTTSTGSTTSSASTVSGFAIGVLFSTMMNLL